MQDQGIPGVSAPDGVVEELLFPRVPTDLLEALEKMFPDRCPDLRITDRGLGVVHGQLNVVRLLREMYDRPSITEKAI